MNKITISFLLTVNFFAGCTFHVYSEELTFPDDMPAITDDSDIFLDLDDDSLPAWCKHFQLNKSVSSGVYDLYFPCDGKQPTTENAVSWSCSNENDEAITEWYMQIFGWTNSGTKALCKCGYDGTGTPSAIITMDANMASNEVEFWDTFRQIAGNSVGRALLYRLLIEIRRKNYTGSGCMAENQGDPSGKRNSCRNVNIKWYCYGNSFNYENHTIKFGIQNPLKKMATVCENEGHGYRTIALCCRPNDIGLFHEMLHWYHYLRKTERYLEERTAIQSTVKLNGYKKGATNVSIDIGRYYWDNLKENNGANGDDDNGWKTSARPWLQKESNGKKYKINFEEIRTILGSHSTVADYIFGDDLSENLYRSTRNCYIRFGHSCILYYEDNDVIQRTVASCDEQGAWYGKYNIQYASVADLDQKDKPGLSYNTIDETGIGACKIDLFRLECIRP